MNAILHTSVSAQLKRIPSEDVEEFITTVLAEQKARQDDNILLNNARKEIAAKRNALAKASRRLEDAIETEADEKARRAAQKYKSLVEAMNFRTALQQVSAIAEDYQNLEGWIVETIMEGVQAILEDIPIQTRWAAMIRKILSETNDRWNLTLICNPKDIDNVISSIKENGFQSALSNIERDATIEPGTMFLRDTVGLHEVNLSTRLRAFEDDFRGALGNALDENAQKNVL